MSDDPYTFDDDELRRLLEDPELERLLDTGPAMQEPIAPASAVAGRDVAVAVQGPVASPRLSGTYLDPDDAEFTPHPRPGRATSSRLFTLLLAVALLGALAWLIVPEVDYRFVHRGELRHDNGILTAQPIPLSWVHPAVVEELYLDYSVLTDELLPAGTPVARLTNTVVNEDERDGAVELTVPMDARFVSVDAPEGSVIYPGQPVITVYDPSLMSVIVTVPASDLERLRRGMTVVMTNDVVSGRITGTVDSAVPLLGTDHEPTTSRLVNVRIRPDPDGVENLVPGIRFRVRIDTDSVPEDAPELVYTDASAQPRTADGSAPDTTAAP